MSTIQYSYPLDTTGNSAINKVTAELHTVTAINDRNYNFLIPTFAPFYAASVRLFKKVGNNLTPMVLGVDWQPAAQFMGASMGTAKPVYGAISLTDVDFTGVVEISEYQTLGGEYTLDIQKMTEVIANIVFNPRGVTWEQLVNLQTMFPPVDHLWDYDHLKGQEEVVEALTAIHDAILSGQNASLEDHLRDYDNPHRLRKNQIELDKVENFGPANSIQAIQGISNDTVITPLVLHAALDGLGLLNLADLIALIQAHLANQQNPHNTTKHHVDLGNVENLLVATTSDILGKKKVRKYLTLDGLIDYMALHSCKGSEEQEEVFPPKDSLLSTYCNGTNNMGIYANGVGGTYERVIEVNSRTCGYVPPPQLPDHPPQGTKLSTYCVNQDQHGLFANGYGGTYSRLIQINSVECGYSGNPPPPNSSHPPSGTVLSQRCEGTTLVKVIANGAGGSYDDPTPNSPNCVGGGVHPPAGQLVDTACVGSDLQGKYTDGAGGFYFAIAEINSTRCLTPTASPAPTPTTLMPAVNIAQNRNELTVNQAVVFTYNASSLQTGQQYRLTFKRRLTSQADTFLQDIPNGTFIISSQSGAYAGSMTYLYTDATNNAGMWFFVALIEKISDPLIKGQSNLLQLELKGAGVTPTPSGGPPADTKPGITLSADNASLSVGQRTTVRASASNLVVGKSYQVSWYRKTASQGGFSEFLQTATFSATSTTNTLPNTVANDGNVSNGQAQFKVVIKQSDNSANQTESGIVNINFSSNRSIVLSMDNSPGLLSIIVGTNVTVRMDFKNFPITGTTSGDGLIRYELRVSGADNRVIQGEPLATDSTGGAVLQFTNVLTAANVRGRAEYQVFSTWTEAGGGTQTTASNMVPVIWYSVDQPNPQPPTPTTPTPTTPTPTTPTPTAGTSSCETVYASGGNLTATATPAGTGYTGTPRYQISGRIVPDTPSRSQLTVISTPHSEGYSRTLFCTPNASEAAIANPANYASKGGMWGRWQSRNLSDNMEFFSYVLFQALIPYNLQGQFVVDPTGSRSLDANGNFSFMAISNVPAGGTF